MRRTLTLGMLLLVLNHAAGAQTRSREDSLLDHLIGNWVLQGPMAGKTVTHDVTFAWVLGREYVEMHEASRERTAAGAPEYEAIVYIMWDSKARQFAGLWLDNTAAAPFPPAGVGHAVFSGDSIPFVFRSSATERFLNTFVYDRRTDSWQWHMDDDKAGKLEQFARVTLTRRRG